MDKVQAIHDHPEVLHAKIHYTQCRTDDDMDVHVPSLYITPLISISRIRENKQSSNLDISFSPEYLTNELINLTINDINYKTPTTEYQALGHFNRINMKRLSTWNKWEKS